MVPADAVAALQAAELDSKGLFDLLGALQQHGPHPLAAAVLRLVLSAAERDGGDGSDLGSSGVDGGGGGMRGEDSMVPLLVEMAVRGGVLGDVGDSTDIDLACDQAAHAYLS
jgi:hypothetical protein